MLKHFDEYFSRTIRKIITNNKIKYSLKDKELIAEKIISLTLSWVYGKDVRKRNRHKFALKFIDCTAKYFETYKNINVYDKDKLRLIFCKYIFLKIKSEITEKNRIKEFKEYIEEIYQQAKEAILEELNNEKDTNFMLKAVKKYGNLTAKICFKHKNLFYRDFDKMTFLCAIMSFIGSRGILMIQNNIPYKYCDKFFKSITYKTIELAIKTGDTCMEYEEFCKYVKPYAKRLVQKYSDEYEKSKRFKKFCLPLFAHI